MATPRGVIPPFVDGREGELDGSLHWAVYAIGKRSVVLDLADEADRARLRELARGADVLVESLEPGTLDALGLGYGDLSALNPALVYASISPFGQTGPHAHRPATDLTLQAAGGLVSMQGDHDRPPIPVGFPQAGLHAGVQAAADVVVALNERDYSGLGQHLDTSMQACIVWTLLDATGYPPNEGRDKPGYGDDRSDPVPPRTAGLDLPTMIEVADGYTTSTMGAALAMLNTANQAVAWMLRDGPELPEHLRGIDWEHWHEDWAEARRCARERAAGERGPPARPRLPPLQDQGRAAPVVARIQGARREDLDRQGPARGPAARGARLLEAGRRAHGARPLRAPLAHADRLGRARPAARRGRSAPRRAASARRQRRAVLDRLDHLERPERAAPPDV